VQDLESQLAREEARRKKLQEEKELFESKERTTDGDIARLETMHEKMIDERNMLEEQVRRFTATSANSTVQNANLTAKMAELEAKCKQMQHEKVKRDSQLEDAERNSAKTISELKAQLEEAEEARSRAERARAKINSEVPFCALRCR
jgi:chromosome segregation ATPase